MIAIDEERLEEALSFARASTSLVDDYIALLQWRIARLARRLGIDLSELETDDW